MKLEFKLSWLLAFGALVDLFLLSLNLAQDKPIGNLLGSFCGMAGWLMSQWELEKFQSKESTKGEQTEPTGETK